jgi:hypothetical protein
VFEQLLPAEYQEFLGMNQLTEEAEEFQGMSLKNIEFVQMMEPVVSICLVMCYLKSGEKCPP